jgi:hypothetical protein
MPLTCGNDARQRWPRRTHADELEGWRGDRPSGERARWCLAPLDHRPDDSPADSLPISEHPFRLPRVEPGAAERATVGGRTPEPLSTALSVGRGPSAPPTGRVASTPVEARFLDVLRGEIRRQCGFALRAWADLTGALAQGDLDRLWYSVQALLVAAGNVSKLMWPPSSRIPQRGAELRRSLDVPEDSILRPRAFRNHFEHFDERLEEWMLSSERHNFADSNVMPPGAIVGLDPSDFLRNLDPTTLTLTFRGDSYELRPLVEEIGALWRKTSETITEDETPID